MFIRNLKKSQKNGKSIKQIGNYKIETNSEHVRHAVQNILAYGWLSPQPVFQVLSKGVKPYFQYHTKNRFTSW